MAACRLPHGHIPQIAEEVRHIAAVSASSTTRIEGISAPLVPFSSRSALASPAGREQIGRHAMRQAPEDFGQLVQMERFDDYMNGAALSQLFLLIVARVAAHETDQDSRVKTAQHVEGRRPV